MIKNVTVVVCVKNSADVVRENLPVVRAALPEAELLVIDGDSTDGTRAIAEGIADKVISDEKKGLAYARMLGITNASRPYVLFSGPDNQISEELALKMESALAADAKLAGVAPQTDVVHASNYWERTTRAFFRHFINKPGPAAVIGTPCMFKRDIILKIPYDPAIRAAADDTDLALRLTEAGYTLAVIDAYSKETMPVDRASFIARWKWYGRGDAEFYAKHRERWSLRRRLRSLMHPLYTYGLRGTWILMRAGEPRSIFGMWVAVASRYRGWIARARELRVASRA